MTENGNGAIIKVDVREIAHGHDCTIQTYDDREVLANLKILRALVPCGRNATDVELAAFLAFCQANKLDPFRRQVHFIKYRETDPPTWVVSYWVYVDRAQRHPQFDGLQNGIIWMADATKRRGQPCDYQEDDHHSIIGGWATVYRKDRKYPFDVEVPLAEMQATKRDGTPTRNWRDMKTTMCVKTPTSRALRLAFAEELGHTYTDAEPIVPAPMSELSADVPERGQVQDVEPEPPEHPALRVEQAVRERLPVEVADEEVQLAMCELAAAVTQMPRDQFMSASSWIEAIVDDCLAHLDTHGLPTTGKEETADVPA